MRQDNSSQSTDAEVGAEARKPRRRLGFWMMIAIIFICLVTDAAGLPPPDGYGGNIYVGAYIQWLSHTNGVRGVPPVRKIHIFGMCFLSVIGLRVKPSGCANVFVN